MSTSRTIIDFLEDIADAMQAASEFVQGINELQFRSDRKTVYAVIRALEVVGEAAKRIPTDVRDRYPDVPWRRLTGMRDRLIHGYDSVDLAIVWATLHEALPLAQAPLEAAIQKERIAAGEAPSGMTDR